MVCMLPEFPVSFESCATAVVSRHSYTMPRYRDVSGLVAGPGDSACTQCAAGKFANVSGQSRCEACAPGSYANGDGMMDCDLCGIG